jgi:hypothetical protein
MQRNAERHLGNADRILALQHWHFSNANQHCTGSNMLDIKQFSTVIIDSMIIIVHGSL